MLEVTTWSQLAIHVKREFSHTLMLLVLIPWVAIILVNVLNYYEPLREQIVKGIEAGFIKEENLNLITFVNGPENMEEHATFDWGAAVTKVLDDYRPTGWKGFGFDWSAKMNNGHANPLSSI